MSDSTTQDSAYLAEILEMLENDELTYSDLEEMECADGCCVEPDGQCEHGHLHPIRLLGLI